MSQSTPVTPRSESVVEGVVVRSTGRWVHVKTCDRVLRSRVRGRFRLQERGPTNPVAVGDRVSMRIGKDGTGYITRVHDRDNHLSRRAAGRHADRRQVLVSNVDAVWVVQSVVLPRPNPGLIDRILVTAEAQEIKAGIVLNKMDLADVTRRSKMRTLQHRYVRLGYAVFPTSAVTGEGLEQFHAALADRISIFMGPSGTGKSTLLNALEPGLALRTGRVSQKTRKGRHTTANAELFLLSTGGGVVDTPGVREFGLLQVEPWELSHHFPEFRNYLNHCRFPACTHSHEPDCRVKLAYRNRAITRDRYNSYLNILHSISIGEADIGR